MSPDAGAPTNLDREFVLRRCRYFASVNLWPTVGDGLDPEAWLGNFEPEEERHALYLLNAYLYFSTRVIDRVFVEAIHGLSRLAEDPHGDPSIFAASWETFLRTALIVPVRGERPNPSDSGALFVRRARDLLALNENQLKEPPYAALAVANEPNRPVILVDDFLGSGSQFIHTWFKSSGIPGQVPTFAALAATGQGRFFYCPVVATEYGRGEIARTCPSVALNPGHLLPNRYGAFAANSLIWPQDLRASAESVLKGASMRAGLSADPKSPDYWKGFRGLGLALGFVHGVPDATLPILHTRRNGWTPLWSLK